MRGMAIHCEGLVGSDRVVIGIGKESILTSGIAWVKFCIGVCSNGESVG